MDVLGFLFTLCLGFVCGSLVAAIALSVFFRARMRQQKMFMLEDAAKQLQLVQTAQELVVEQERSELKQQLAESVARGEELRVRVTEMEQQRQVERSEQAHEQESQHRILESLAPIGKSVVQLEQTLLSLEQQRAKQHGEIATQLRNAAASEERIRATTETLASALQDIRVRGKWGEMTLRRVLEEAGLSEHIDFVEQQSIQAEESRLRPDVIVKLPNDHTIVIDSKAPLNFSSWDQSLSTEESITQDQYAEIAKQHAKNMRMHIKQLSSRKYDSQIQHSLHLVVAFVPSESLLSAALRADPTLLEYAYQNGIALASPVTLWAILRAVAQSWQQEKLTRETEKIILASKALHTNLKHLLKHAQQLGASFGRSVKHYNSFIKSFEDRVLPKAATVARFHGEHPEHKLTQIEESPIHYTEENETPPEE